MIIRLPTWKSVKQFEESVIVHIRNAFANEKIQLEDVLEYFSGDERAAKGHIVKIVKHRYYSVPMSMDLAPHAMTPNSCCTREARSMNGGCMNCGDPCL